VARKVPAICFAVSDRKSRFHSARADEELAVDFRRCEMQFCRDSADFRCLFSCTSKGVCWRCCHLNVRSLSLLGWFPGAGSALPYRCERSTLRERMEGIIAVVNARWRATSWCARLVEEPAGYAYIAGRGEGGHL
jgi:hypothetical protein